MAKQKEIKFQDRHGDLRGRQNGIQYGTNWRRAGTAGRITSTEYAKAVLEAMERWECTVNAWDGG